MNQTMDIGYAGICGIVVCNGGTGQVWCCLNLSVDIQQRYW